MQPTTPAPKKPRRKGRSIAAIIHLWLGLTSGVILTISGLTGSYLAFYPELERAFIAPLRQADGKHPESLEVFHQALTKIGPPERGAWNIEMPRPDGGVITSRFSEKGKGNRMVSVDPVTFEVVRDVYWGKELSTWLYELHYRLLLGRDGQPVMGVLALLALTMVVLGGVLWWQSGKTIKQRLAVDLKGTFQRQLFDIHRIFGAVSLVFLVIILATAAAMNLPKQVKPVLALISESEGRAPRPKSGKSEGRPRITVDEAVTLARQEMPHGTVRWVQVPNKPDGAYGVRFWQDGDPNYRFPKSYVWIDQFSGKTVSVQDSLKQKPADAIQSWFYPLHAGMAFGIVGRSIVAIIGLVPLILLITGVLRWRAKARSQAAQKRRLALKTQTQN